MSELLPTIKKAQKCIDLSYDGLDLHKRLWIDASIQNGELSISKVACHCSLTTNESEHTWRKRFYIWKHRIPEFETIWYLHFEKHYKKRVQTKIYARLAQLIDRETDISKLVELLQSIEETPQAKTPFPILGGLSQIIQRDQYVYGIGVKDNTGKEVEI